MHTQHRSLDQVRTEKPPSSTHETHPHFFGFASPVRLACCFCTVSLSLAASTVRSTGVPRADGFCCRACSAQSTQMPLHAVLGGMRNSALAEIASGRR